MRSVGLLTILILVAIVGTIGYTIYNELMTLTLSRYDAIMEVSNAVYK
jgi:hypothetical protein